MNQDEKKLNAQECVTLSKDAKPLTGSELQQWYNRLSGDWKLIDDQKLEKLFSFVDYPKTWHFVDQVAALAQKQNHHPDIFFTWGKATITLSTHSVGGLSKNDFIMAAKIEALHEILF